MGYSTFARGFSAAAYYRGASAGAFNAVASDNTFAAFCTFSLNSGLQAPGGSPTGEYLWGNSEDANFSGWSLELVASGGELLLQAKVGDGSAYATVQEPITGPAVAATGQLPAAGIFNRLIQAALYLDGTNIVLAVNGTICGFTAFDPTTFSPSALAASLGAGTAAVAALPATFAEILACGYSSDVEYATGIGPGYMGSAFVAAQETDGNAGFIVADQGLDWTHRYSFQSAAQGLPGTVNKTAAGNLVTGYPVGPSSLADLGGKGRANLGTYSPVALAKGGGSTTLPILSQRTRADWAHLGTFFYTP
jgi:hypothetical protein